MYSVGKTTYVPLQDRMEGAYGRYSRSYSNKNNEQCGLFYACSASLEPRFREEIKYNIISFSWRRGG
jgi:hypothetical protein